MVSLSLGLEESRGKRPLSHKRLAYESLHHLTHATNQLEAAFGSTFDLRRCGVPTPDAVRGRVNDRRSENIIVEYEMDGKGTPGWQDFLAKLKVLEDDWDHESVPDGLWERVKNNGTKENESLGH